MRAPRSVPKPAPKARTSLAKAAGTVHRQGGHVPYVDSAGQQLDHKESLKDNARVLDRMFDGIEHRDFHQTWCRTSRAFRMCRCGTG